VLKLVARGALLCDGLTAIAICLALVYLEKLDTSSASYAKGGLTAGIDCRSNGRSVELDQCRFRTRDLLGNSGVESACDIKAVELDGCLGRWRRGSHDCDGFGRASCTGLAYTAGSSVGILTGLSRPATIKIVIIKHSIEMDPPTTNRLYLSLANAGLRFLESWVKPVWSTIPTRTLEISSPLTITGYAKSKHIVPARHVNR
jgi:hypothetical protein